MIRTLGRLLMVSRPISWLNTAYPFAAGYIVSGGSSLAMLIIGTLFFLIPYNLLMYGINDVFDYESDIKNPRKGGVEGMREQRAFHPIIIKVSTISVIPFVIWLITNGSTINNLTLAGLIFFVIAYSVSGLRFKEIPILDSITSSIHFVGPLVYGLSFGDFSQASWLVIVAFFLWGMASHALGAIQDILPDRKGSISSIATALGARKTLYVVVALYTTAAILSLYLPTYGWIISLVGLLYIANCYDIRNVNDQDSPRANRPWRRFLLLNQLAGFVITLVLIHSLIS